MRPIKFRFWNKLAYRFQPPSKYAIDGEGKLVSYDYEVGAYDDPIDFAKSIIVPQQYTGIKDKNGKDVYEGDIIKVFWLDMEPYNDKVRWDTYVTGWYPKGPLTTKHEQVSFEVIGNIFENPELLKQ